MIEFFAGFAIGGFIMAVVAWTYGVNEAAQQCILELLARSPRPMYGLELIEQSAGFLKRGTIYVLLGRLEDRGLVVSKLAGADGRRVYSLPSSSTGGNECK